MGSTAVGDAGLGLMSLSDLEGFCSSFDCEAVWNGSTMTSVGLGLALVESGGVDDSVSGPSMKSVVVSSRNVA